MAKTKKLLCMAMVVIFAMSFITLPASAAVTTTANATFDDGAWPETMSRLSFLNTIPASIYGKDANDHSPQAQTGFDNATDRFFIVNGPVTLPDGGKLKISFDIAGDALTNPVHSTYGHYVSMKLNGSAYKYILQSNNVSCDTSVTINSHFNDNAWNNVTALFEFAEGNATSKYTLYINGEAVYTNASFNPWATKGFSTWTSISDFRFGGHMLSNKLYYDNIVVETYESTDSIPATTFAAQATGSAVDNDNKKINVGTNYAMNVGDLKANTTGIVVLDADGAAVADDTKVIDDDINIYAVYANGINQYYEPYTTSFEPPVITGNDVTYQAIIDNEAHTIRLVDTPNLTVGEFKANTTGATVKTPAGEIAADTALLSSCKVTAEADGIEPVAYTFITSRSYAVEKEIFNGTFSKRTSGLGAIYTNGDVGFMGNVNGAVVEFNGVGGLGGKAADDLSQAMIVTDTEGVKDPFFYFNSQPYLTNKVINTTHTVETKLLVKDMKNVTSVDMVVNGRVAVKLLPNGVIQTTDGTVDVTALTGGWKDNTWLPIAVTYDKGTNRIHVYVNGVDTKCSWTPTPNGYDIRFRAICATDAAVTVAIDDFKLYTDSLELYKYSADGTKVTLTTTESLNNVPIIAEYATDGTLADIVIGTTTKSIEHTYTEGNTVKIMVWESLKTLKPLIPIKKLIPQ